MHSNSSQVVIVGLVICAAIVYTIFKKIAEELGLDLDTVALVAGQLGLTLALSLAAWKLSPLPLSMIIPISLIFIWGAFWPVLDYWSLEEMKQSSLFYRFNQDDSFWDQAAPVWYATWYTKWGVLIALLIGGGYLSRNLD